MRALWTFALVLGALPLVGSCSGEDPTPEEPAKFVGRKACAECHQKELEAWTGSHHDDAMQEASEANILGDFANVEFTHHGVTTRFFRRDGKFMVRTDGPDGQPNDYEVAYTFGVSPLQQYLIRLDGGRLQSLGICWDSRPKADGGQRWFHVYGKEKVPHTDELHWTGRNQNWNFMCARCHSTGLQKAYNSTNDSYSTTWAEIDVSCESCHGPGSRHVTWARRGGEGSARGLVVALGDRGEWVFDKGAATARRADAAQGHAQTEACARCHARGTPLIDGLAQGQPLLDSQTIARLDEGLYHADGQILDEVFVYGSFVQSKMYHAGVTCSDCHEPHSLRLRAQGNALCARCHQSSAFDTKAHTMHEPDSTGSSCVACHMPAKHYMVVDPRRDHSLRIPRPDLSVRLGTPNACTGCHQDKPASWAADAIAQHRGDRHQLRPHYGETIHAARQGRAGAPEAVRRLAADARWPAIVRATALSYLRGFASKKSLAVIRAGLRDTSAMVRAAALERLEEYPLEVATPLAAPLLADRIRLVRTEAARLLAGVPADRLPAGYATQLPAAIADYRQTQLVHADQPWAHVNLGLLELRLDNLEGAKSRFERARSIEPRWTAAYINLADVYRLRGEDERGERVLREGLGRATGNAAIRNALGLLLARTKRLEKARIELERAARARPDVARFSYAHAVALHSAGRTKQAMRVLVAAHGRHPSDRDLLIALATFERDRGARDKAIAWAKKLVGRDPDDRSASELLRSLTERR